MNKYQDALYKIVKSCCPNCTTNGCKDCSIEKICNATAKSWVDRLQELVDKATPKKRIFVDATPSISAHDECPVCRVKVSPIRHYCDNCGQRLE